MGCHGATIAHIANIVWRQHLGAITRQTPHIELIIYTLSGGHEEDKPVGATTLLAARLKRLKAVHKVQSLRLNILLDIVVANEPKLRLLQFQVP